MGQADQPPAAYVLGTISIQTLLWCVQLIPQIVANWRTKSTEGLPKLMMLFFAICAVPFGAYAIVQNLNIPVQLQPQCFGTLSLISLAQCLHYGSKWRTWTATLAAVALFVLFGSIEIALILTLRPLYEHGTTYPLTIVGVVASVLLGVSLLPPYPELWKRRGQVVGIDFTFLAVDLSGALFGLMSLVAQRKFDMLGGVVYIVCMVLESGIFLSQGIWLLRTRKLRKAERALREAEQMANELEAELAKAFARGPVTAGPVETGGISILRDPEKAMVKALASEWDFLKDGPMLPGPGSY